MIEKTVYFNGGMKRNRKVIDEEGESFKSDFLDGEITFGPFHHIEEFKQGDYEFVNEQAGGGSFVGFWGKDENDNVEAFAITYSEDSWATCGFDYGILLDVPAKEIAFSRKVRMQYNGKLQEALDIWKVLQVDNKTLYIFKIIGEQKGTEIRFLKEELDNL